MDVGGQAADELLKDSMQIAETAVKLAGTGLKNVAALLMALSKQDYKVVGQTSSKRLARDPTPAAVFHLKREDIPQFRRLAREHGVLYFLAMKRGNENGIVNVVTNQKYVASINMVMEELRYPIPGREERAAPKKAVPRVPQDKCSPERGNGSARSKMTPTDKKPSVKARLATLKAASKEAGHHQQQRKQNKAR